MWKYAQTKIKKIEEYNEKLQSQSIVSVFKDYVIDELERILLIQLKKLKDEDERGY